MTVVRLSFYISLFPRLKLKLNVRHFDTIEVIEPESQAVLKAYTEYDFHQDRFMKWQKRWELCISAEGDYFEGDGGHWAASVTDIVNGSAKTIFTHPPFL
jgi:hypothetical protein